MIIKPKGTYDLMGRKAREEQVLRQIIDDLMERFNYEYFRTPVFESSELYHRGVGESTDIVTKETYDFVDRGNRNMTLRPEGTAGVVRSYIENKFYADASLPKKVYYYGNMYRYERPQSGRFREFTQFGVEALGANDPMIDAEVINIAVELFSNLGLKEIKVKINTLGDKESRNAYRDALTEHFKPHIEELCDDCKARFSKNPLRMLDCKVDKDSPVLANVPRTVDYLNEESRVYFDKVLEYLNALNIDYEVDTSIVRGLDYYSHTVFEIEANVEGFGSQNVLCGGGRYDGLAKSLDGPDTPAVGFAIGIERLLTALEYEKIDLLGEVGIDCYVAPLGDEEKAFAFSLVNALRILGFCCDIDFKNRSLKANFKQAERLNAKKMIIVGEDELNNNYVTVKDLETSLEEKVKNEEIIKYLSDALFDDLDDECDCGCSHE